MEMPAPITAEAGAFALAFADAERLGDHLAAAQRRARRSSTGEALAAITVALPRGADPTAIVVSSRIGGEPWFVFEQPDRARAALATLGLATAIEAHGPGRFAEVAARWRKLAAGAVADVPDGPRGSGPVAVGGFAFAPEGGGAPAGHRD